MKILFVTSEIPYPADNGVRIVSGNIMRLMAEAGHELELAVLTAETGDLDRRMREATYQCVGRYSFYMTIEKKSFWEILIKSLATGSMYFMEKYKSGRFRKRLKSVVFEFNPDAVHFDMIPMTQYIDVVSKDKKTVASINDSYTLTLINGFESDAFRGFEKVYRKIQYFQVKNYEKNKYTNFSVVHTMTDVDANYLKKLNSKTKTIAIPNGVMDALFRVAEEKRKSFEIVYVAKLQGNYLDIIEDFLKISWPIIRKAQPCAKLRIVGRRGTNIKYLEELSTKLGNISIEGYVDKIEDIYKTCDIAIVPLNRNCGIINKAIEAMAAGIVVVCFKKTLEGIKNIENGKHFVAVDNYKEMGKEIISLYEQKNRREQIKLAAHKFAKENFDWKTRVYLYEKMYSKDIIQ